MHLFHETAEVQRDHAGRADLTAPADLEARHAPRFLREVRDRHVDPLVDNRFAEQADAEVARRHDKTLELIQGEAEPRQVAKADFVVPQQRIVLRRLGGGQQEVRKLRRGERLTGREVEGRVSIDPDVIGGVLISIGDLVIDGTVRLRVERLRDALAESA